MAKIPPPPAHLHPSSPAFAEWMRAVAKGLADYTDSVNNYMPFSQVLNANYGGAPFGLTWQKAAEIRMEPPEKDALVELLYNVSVRFGGDYCYVRVRKKVNGVYTQLLNTPHMLHEISGHIPDAIPKGQNVQSYELWVRSAGYTGGSVAKLIAIGFTAVRR